MGPTCRTERITDRLLREVLKLAPNARPPEIRDTEIMGFTMRTAAMTPYAEWGRGKRRALRDANGNVMHFPVATVSMMRAAVLEVLADAARNGVPSIAQAKAKGMTLEVFLDELYEPWALAHLKSGKETLAALRAQFTQRKATPTGKPARAPTVDLGDKVMGNFTRFDVEKFQTKRLNDGIKPATINRDVDRLMAAFNKCAEWKEKTGLTANPIAGVKDVVNDAEERTRYLTPEEEQQLRSALQAREHKRRAERESANAWRRERGYEELPDFPEDGYTDHLMPVVLLALNTGLRRGELLKLRWEKVNLEARRIEVPAKTRKTSKVLHMRMNSEVFDVLTRVRKHSLGKGFIFGDGDTALKGVKSSWANLMKAAQITDFRFHDQRHHFASWLVMKSVDLYAVQKLLGHSSPTMTQRYAHLAPEHLADAVEKLVQK